MPDTKFSEAQIAALVGGSSHEILSLTEDELLTHQDAGSDPPTYSNLAGKFLFVKKGEGLPARVLYIDTDGSVVLLSEAVDPSDENLLSEILDLLGLANQHIDACLTRVG
jgi:hypothetical protein